MRLRSRWTVAGAAGLIALSPLLVANFALGAAPNGLGGSGSTGCNDGTVTWSPTNLWPPNHKMHTIAISYGETDGEGDQLSVDIGQIQELPANTDTVGAGQPTAQQGPDFTGANTTGTFTANDSTAATPSQPVTLRAERSGQDTTGRTYLIPVTCNDKGGTDLTETTGKSQTVDICVVVPHDQAHPATPAGSCVPM